MGIHLQRRQLALERQILLPPQRHPKTEPEHLPQVHILSLPRLTLAKPTIRLARPPLPLVAALLVPNNPTDPSLEPAAHPPEEHQPDPGLPGVPVRTHFREVPADQRGGTGESTRGQRGEDY